MEQQVLLHKKMSQLNSKTPKLTSPVKTEPITKILTEKKPEIENVNEGKSLNDDSLKELEGMFGLDRMEKGEVIQNDRNFINRNFESKLLNFEEELDCSPQPTQEPLEDDLNRCLQEISVIHADNDTSNVKNSQNKTDCIDDRSQSKIIDKSNSIFDKPKLQIEESPRIFKG